MQLIILLFVTSLHLWNVLGQAIVQSRKCNPSVGDYECPGGGICLGNMNILNGVKDCPGGEDEDSLLHDECKLGRDNCLKDVGICQDSPNTTFTCICPPKQYGDGVTYCENTPRSGETLRGNYGPDPVSLAGSYDISKRIPGRCNNTERFDCGAAKPMCLSTNFWRNCEPNCPDGSDEWCPLGTYRCGNCKCVPPRLLGIGQCQKSKLCEVSGSVNCSGNKECALKEWILDGKHDCADASDEDPSYIAWLRNGKVGRKPTPGFPKPDSSSGTNGNSGSGNNENSGANSGNANTGPGNNSGKGGSGNSGSQPSNGGNSNSGSGNSGSGTGSGNGSNGGSNTGNGTPNSGNSGTGNTGSNSGNSGSGTPNSGNSGTGNTGNSGNKTPNSGNSGTGNTGNSGSGNPNHGSPNSGNTNAGNSGSGNSNSNNGNAGTGSGTGTNAANGNGSGSGNGNSNGGTGSGTAGTGTNPTNNNETRKDQIIIGSTNNASGANTNGGQGNPNSGSGNNATGANTNGGQGNPNSGSGNNATGANTNGGQGNPNSGSGNNATGANTNGGQGNPNSGSGNNATGANTNGGQGNPNSGSGNNATGANTNGGQGNPNSGSGNNATGANTNGGQGNPNSGTGNNATGANTNGGQGNPNSGSGNNASGANTNGGQGNPNSGTGNNASGTNTNTGSENSNSGSSSKPQNGSNSNGKPGSTNTIQPGSGAKTGNNTSGINNGGSNGKAVNGNGTSATGIGNGNSSSPNGSNKSPINGTDSISNTNNQGSGGNPNKGANGGSTATVMSAKPATTTRNHATMKQKTNPLTTTSFVPTSATTPKNNPDKGNAGNRAGSNITSNSNSSGQQNPRPLTISSSSSSSTAAKSTTTTTTQSAAAAADDAYNKCYSDLLTQARARYPNTTATNAFICHCPGGQLMGADGKCHLSGSSGTVQVRTGNICGRTIVFDQQYSQVNSKKYDELAVILLYSAESTVKTNGKESTFTDLCIPKMPMAEGTGSESGSVWFPLTLQCANVQDCTKSQLQQAFAVQSGSTAKFDTNSFSDISCKTGRNNCDLRSTCITQGLAFTCKCNAGYADTSTNKNAPGRICVWNATGTQPPLETTTAFVIGRAGFSGGGGGGDCSDLNIGGSCVPVSTLVIILLVILAALMLIGCCICYYFKKKRANDQEMLVNPEEDDVPVTAWEDETNRSKPSSRPTSEGRQRGKRRSSSSGDSHLEDIELGDDKKLDDGSPELYNTYMKDKSSLAKIEEEKPAEEEELVETNDAQTGTDTRPSTTSSSASSSSTKSHNSEEMIRNEDRDSPESPHDERGEPFNAEMPKRSASLSSYANMEHDDEYRLWKEKMHLKSPEPGKSDAELLRQYGLPKTPSYSQSPSIGGYSRPETANHEHQRSPSPDYDENHHHAADSHSLGESIEREATNDTAVTGDGLFKESLWWKSKPKSMFKK